MIEIKEEGFSSHFAALRPQEERNSVQAREKLHKNYIVHGEETIGLLNFYYRRGH